MLAWFEKTIASGGALGEVVRHLVAIPIRIFLEKGASEH
jgi:hypothetical protein